MEVQLSTPPPQSAANGSIAGVISAVTGQVFTNSGQAGTFTVKLTAVRAGLLTVKFVVEAGVSAGAFGTEPPITSPVGCCYTISTKAVRILSG